MALYVNLYTVCLLSYRQCMTTAAPHTPTATTAGVTLRDRAREAVRDEVLIRAWLLFAEQGFTATTVEQIAEAAGMSRRTFFRYFNGKHELVAAALRSSGDQVAAALQARPATECAWHALRAAFDALITDVEGHDDLARSLHRMLQQEPEVRAASYERSHR